MLIEKKCILYYNKLSVYNNSFISFEWQHLLHEISLQGIEINKGNGSVYILLHVCRTVSTFKAVLHVVLLQFICKCDMIENKCSVYETMNRMQLIER